jgi:hypothetical protein
MLLEAVGPTTSADYPAISSAKGSIGGFRPQSEIARTGKRLASFCLLPRRLRAECHRRINVVDLAEHGLSICGSGRNQRFSSSSLRSDTRIALLPAFLPGRCRKTRAGRHLRAVATSKSADRLGASQAHLPSGTFSRCIGVTLLARCSDFTATSTLHGG